MAQIKCVDCLKTYQPYRYNIALLRVLMYGFSDWEEFEEEGIIENHFREQWQDRSFRSWLINRTNTYSKDHSFGGDFNFYYLYLENKRRRTISATFVCFNCEKYFCSNCTIKHSGHLTFSKHDKYSISKHRRINVEMLEKLLTQGDLKGDNIGLEQTFLCDVVDIRCEQDKLPLDEVLHSFNEFRSDWYLLHNLYDFYVRDMCFLNGEQKCLITDQRNKCIKIFSVNNNKLTRSLTLSSRPCGITGIPSTDPLQSLIAVSVPYCKQINIMNINSESAQVISSLNVQGKCYDIAYCNNKLITRCWDYLDGEHRDLIHVLDMSGEIIKMIDLLNLPSIKLKRPYTCRMSVHSKNETIYVSHWREPSCVIGMSLDGKVLHSVTFTDLEPRLICVGIDQHVYVMDYRLPLYRLSADLSIREKVIDKGVGRIPLIRAMSFHNDKIYLASNEGHVYIIQHDQYVSWACRG